MKLHFYIFLPIIIISCLAALWVAHKRISLEEGLDTVCMVMDYDDWEIFCIQNGYNLEESLPLLKEAGISSFGVYEDTCKRLELKGKLLVMKGSDILNTYRLTGLSDSILKSLVEEGKIVSDNIYIVFPDNSPYIDAVEEYFIRFFTSDRVICHKKPSSTVIEVMAEYSQVMNTGTGIPGDTVSRLFDRGFYIVPRLENRSLTPENLEFIFQNLKNTPGCSAVIFSGMTNEVLGYPDLLKETAAAIKENDFYFGYVEVPVLDNLQKGTMTLAGYDITRVIRVISLTQAYQQKLRLDQMLDIWSLAVRERNIRLLYIRPLTEPIEDMNLMESNLYYFKLCREEIEAGGYKVGTVKGMGRMDTPLWLSILLGAGIVSAALLLFAKIFQVSLKNSLLLAPGGFLFLTVGLLGAASFFSKLLALAGGIIFPLFALIFGCPFLFLSIEKQKKSSSGNLRNIIFSLKTLWIVSLICVMGSLVSIGLLSSTGFFLAVDRFRGIKFLMIAPVIFILFIYFYSSVEKNRFHTLFKKTIDLLKIPVQLWQIFLILAITAAGIFYISRTGNVPVLAVSDWERDLRAFLDTLLVVRPRFKDFLIGAPALFLAAYLWKKGNEKFLWILLALAALGQANMVDTFAHIHTPLKVTFLRIFNGLWIGSFVGVIMAGLYNLLVFSRSRLCRYFKTGETG